MNRRASPAGAMALGGILAALAIIIMCLGGLIPVSTYVCPLLCAILLQVVFQVCGRSVAWAWYGAVCVLGLLLSPDKEAAATFLFLGYYPIVKPSLDRKKGGWLRKLLLFNVSIGVMYWILLKVMGVPEFMEEFREIGIGLTAVLVVLGNLSFFLLDRVLEKPFFRKLGTGGT